MGMADETQACFAGIRGSSELEQSLLFCAILDYWEGYMKNTKRFGLIAALSAALFAICVDPARADFIVPLAVPNAALSGFTGPYVQLDIHLIDSSHATVTFESLTQGGNIYLM